MSKNVVGWIDIELSKAGQEAIVALKENEVLAVRMKHVNSSIESLPKVQVEFAQKINTGDNGVQSVGAMFNAKDSRYSQGAQRCWETMDLEIAEKMFGEIPEGEAYTEILTVLESPDTAKKFAIQVQEVTESQANESELNYPNSFFKRAGLEGDYFYSEETNEKVGTRRRLVLLDADKEVPHTFIKGSFKPETNLASIMTQGSSKSEVQTAGA